MSEQSASYEQEQLRKSSEGFVAGHAKALACMQETQKQVAAQGDWANPDHDPNDLIGGLLEAIFAVVNEAMMGTGQQNCEVGHGQGLGMQAMYGNVADTEDVNIGLSKSV